MKKYIYQNKETGKKMITSEKLKSPWKKIGEWRTGQFEPDKIRTK